MKWRNRGVDYTWSGYLFLLPNAVGFLLFVLLPVMASLVLSFCEWEILREPSPHWIGLKNFKDLIVSADFWFYTYNTVFLMLGIPIGMALSLGLAVLLNRTLRAIKLFRTVYFLPTITAGVALLVLWMWIYEPTYGLVNVTLARIGIEGPDWLSGSVELPFLTKLGISSTCYWAKPLLMLMGLWTGVGGYNMLLYLAALQGINPELYEAADVDGAGGWRKFRAITWPMLAPTTFFIFIMSLIDGFQGGFEAAYVMTKGGPNYNTTTVAYEIFRQLYEDHQAGYASAIAWFLFLVVFLLTMASWRFGGRSANYD